MSWMILLMKEKDLVGDVWGDGCRYCRFLNTLKTRAECICDERVNVYRDGKLSDHRPYECPFRYYTNVEPITDRLYGMTKEETAGFFAGAQSEHANYVALEENRDKFVQSDAYRRYHANESLVDP